eukprot:2995532-Prymnesium_polylepis.1
MIYDHDGRLFTWLGSESTLGDAEVLDQDLTKPAGYAAVRASIILAARASPRRCSYEVDSAGGCGVAWVAFSVRLLVVLGCSSRHGPSAGAHTNGLRSSSPNLALRARLGRCKGAGDSEEQRHIHPLDEHSRSARSVIRKGASRKPTASEAGTAG